MSENSHGLDRDRLGVLSGALILGLSIGRFIETPVRNLETSMLGSPAGVILSSRTIFLAIMAGMAVTATDSLIRSHPKARLGNLAHSYQHWIVPGLVVLGLTSWLAGFEDLQRWTLLLIVSAIVIPVALAAEYHSVSPEDEQQPFASWVITVMAYLAALVLYTRIYDLGVRAILSGTAILFVSALLMFRLLWDIVEQPLVNVVLSLAMGLVVGLISWGLNYLNLATLTGGMILLIVFYFVSGLLRNELRDQLSLAVLLEHIGVAAVILLLVWQFT